MKNTEPQEKKNEDSELLDWADEHIFKIDTGLMTLRDAVRLAKKRYENKRSRQPDLR